MKSHSFTKVNKSILFDACKKIIADINFERNRIDEKRIADTLESAAKHKFINKIFSRHITREWAIKELSSDVWNSFPSVYKYIELEIAEKLIILANESAEEFVYVTAEDFQYVCIEFHTLKENRKSNVTGEYYG